MRTTTATTPAALEEKEECTHDECVNGLCARCGRVVADTGVKLTHGVVLSAARAAALQRAAEEALLQARKLALVLDLDETLVSACHEALPPGAAAELPPGAFVSFGAEEAHRLEMRPHLAEFLAQMDALFELHLYTFGCAAYAREVLRIVDPTGILFRGRVVARENRPDEHMLLPPPSSQLFGDADEGRQAEVILLKQIIPTMGGLATTLVVDDRADVWNAIPNLIQIEPCAKHLHCLSKHLTAPQSEGLEGPRNHLLSEFRRQKTRTCFTLQKSSVTCTGAFTSSSMLAKPLMSARS